MQWPFGRSPKLLPHCHAVEVLHIPKVSGTALILSLVRANASACYSDTWIASRKTGHCARLPPEQECCRECDGTSCAYAPRATSYAPRAASCSQHTIGIHERAFGTSSAGNATTLYLALVRQPQAWLLSALVQTCATNSDQEAACRGHDPRAFLKWFAQPTPQYYYATPNLQTSMLGNVYASRSWAICTLERRERIQRALSAVAGVQLSSTRTVSTTFSTNVNMSVDQMPWRGNFSFDPYRHLFHSDAALWRHVTDSGGCIFRLAPRWHTLNAIFNARRGSQRRGDTRESSSW